MIICVSCFQEIQILNVQRQPFGNSPMLTWCTVNLEIFARVLFSLLSLFVGSLICGDVPSVFPSLASAQCLFLTVPWAGFRSVFVQKIFQNAYVAHND